MAALVEPPAMMEELPVQVDALNTVTSALTMQEYFAKRMAKLKKAQPDVDNGKTAPASMIVEKSGCLKAQPKKKKSHKYLELETESRIRAEGPEMVDSSREEVGDQEAQKKKRKKSKHHSPTCNESPNSIQEKALSFSGASDTENNEREVPKSKKRDMKKHKKQNKDQAKGVRSSKTKKKKYSS